MSEDRPEGHDPWRASRVSENTQWAKEKLLSDDPTEKDRGYHYLLYAVLSDWKTERPDREVVIDGQVLAATSGGLSVRVPTQELNLPDNFFAPTLFSHGINMKGKEVYDIGVNKEGEVLVESRVDTYVSKYSFRRNPLVVVECGFTREIEVGGKRDYIVVTRDYMLDKKGKTVVTERWNNEIEVDVQAPPSLSMRPAMRTRVVETEASGDFWAKVYESVSSRHPEKLKE